MNVLLVFTTGRTDVQLLLDSERVEIERNHCAVLHAEIKRRERDWKVTNVPRRKRKKQCSELPVGEFKLCTPKLDAVLEHISNEGLQLTHALILETRRIPEANRGDPIAAGLVLERRLRGALGDDITVRRVPYLLRNEALEDRNDPRGALIRRNVVERLDEAIRSTLSEDAFAHVVVSATGGFPVVTELTEEAVRLYAHGIVVECLEVADGTRADPPTKDRAVMRNILPTPAESYRARRRALELIENGSLLAAWGAVRHVDDDEIERRWTRVVEWVERFAASLPVPEDCDIPVLTDRNKAVRTALRVEFALRSGDIPRAVHGTVAFFEGALWDHLGPHLTPHESPDKNRYYKVNPRPEENLIRKGNNNPDDRRRPFEIKRLDNEEWFWVHDDNVCAIRIAKHYLRLDALKKLGKAVAKVRELRNDVAHNEPTPELMDEAWRNMVEAELWSPKRSFLDRPLVQNVLTELGEQHPGRLCENLVSTIRTRLLSPAP